ncbi:ribose-5-phosphate isomerase [Tessaracoccus sp. Y1736]
MGLRVVLAADQAGVSYKDAIKDMLHNDPRVDEVIDVGVNADTDPTAYPHLGVAGARKIANGEADRGIFVCGTGMGVAMAANKVPGVRASTAHDSFSVERLVLSNNGQVLCLGQRVIGEQLALRLANEFLGYQFDPTSASADKVDALCSYEPPAP